MNRRLSAYAKVTAFATFVLIIAGGLVTSTGSGLAVPDWPLSYGMFFPPMVGGIFYEHGHRMVAASVGFLVLVLAIWTGIKEPRTSVRRLAYLALFAVVLQGVLGGLTVIYLLPMPISIAHACLGQAFLCLVVSIAVLFSRAWFEMASNEVSPSLCRWGMVVTSMVWVQLLIGATVRHMGAGLAIPDFPASFGHLVPPEWSLPVLMQFLHRIWGIVVTVALTGLTVLTFQRKSSRKLKAIALAVTVLAFVQIVLGAYVIWTEKGFMIATAHVATGAMILAASVAYTLLAYRGSRREVEKIHFSPRIVMELAKPRITAMVTFTAAVGFYLGAGANIDIWRFLSLACGTILVASGANAGNQYLERWLDGKMNRTSGRPLPSGRVTPHLALGVSIVLSFSGFAVYLAGTNLLALFLAALTEAIYLGVYTPLKVKTPFCTVVGAVPGAIPPMIGWAAARGSIESEAWILFGILFLWQLPHFWAIAWLYRKDYERAGMPMLPVVDPSGLVTRRMTILSGGALALAALLPVVGGMAGKTYLVGSTLLGVFFAAAILQWFRSRSDQAARKVVLASVGYLPVLMVLLAVYKS